MTMTKEERRQAMPQVAAWMDDLRAAFGAAYVERAIMSEGLKTGTYWTSENGLEVGTPPPPPDPAKCRDADSLLEGSRRIKKYLGLKPEDVLDHDYYAKGGT